MSKCAADLAGIHGNDMGQLEVLLSQAHALGPVGNVTLAHLPALLILDHAEHSERPVLSCRHTIQVVTGQHTLMRSTTADAWADLTMCNKIY